VIDSLAKLAYSLLALVVLVVYWRHYGARNFLWLSDVALFGLVLSWWLRSSLLASMIAVGTLAVELFWVLSLGLRLLVGRSPGGLVEYLFDRRRPRALRALSLFHLALPAVMLHQLAAFGYDPRAPIFWVPVALLLLFLSRRYASREENLNWALGPGRVEERLPAPLYLGLWLMVYLLALVLPTHFLLGAIFPPPGLPQSS
jgi:hypothetical protein